MNADASIQINLADNDRLRATVAHNDTGGFWSLRINAYHVSVSITGDLDQLEDLLADALHQTVAAKDENARLVAELGIPDDLDPAATVRMATYNGNPTIRGGAF